ncbi:hypothetical protein NP493_1223g00005 [Ridgeia piscesae]|uniref:DNA polymerase alpha subunit B n=1 Tax=Ridgeia piscesae TaxID=27915 RepID=A0AAD9KBP5_RIDPI|nr:hypothetical protein NP493_1223g00005 [Ridgeia piscesae]
MAAPTASVTVMMAPQNPLGLLHSPPGVSLQSQAHRPRSTANARMRVTWCVNLVTARPPGGILGHPQSRYLTLAGCRRSYKRFKYMFQKLMSNAFVLDDQIESMGKLLKEHHSIGDLAHVALPVQETVTVVGRLCCDSDGKLNAKSIVLEGSRETSGGRHIQLDLSAIERYSLFPGQIVALDGINSSGKTFVATKLYQGVPLPLAKPTETAQAGGISVVIAAGPFTTSDCLSYEPLEDLMKYLTKETPDVCILIGPFVDSRHPDIEKLPMTYDDFFLTIIAKMADCTQSLSMELVVLPSQWDVHHDPVYPQPPFTCCFVLQRKIHFMSDPCTLNINGVVFGVTSTDVLLHLGKEEISRYFLHCCCCQDITGCCCINPGRLTKGKVAGTFCRLVVSHNGQATQSKYNRSELVTLGFSHLCLLYKVCILLETCY